MNDGDATILHFVQSNSPEAGLGEPRQMWVAATDRDEAVEAVQKLVPEGHIVRLVMSHEAPSGAIDLELKPGEVFRTKSHRTSRREARLLQNPGANGRSGAGIVSSA